jgi:hypothetical protein
MMTDWREKKVNMLQLSGKGERTQKAYTRAVRMLIEFTGKSPDLITESLFSSTISSTERTPASGLPTRCASAMRASASSTRRCFAATGTSLGCCAPNPSIAYRPFSVEKESTGCSVV